METLKARAEPQISRATVELPVSVIVAARNEARNLPACLESLRGVGEVYVVDSFSADATPEVATSYGAHVVQFDYCGGWPKKRQWAIDTLPLAHDWILLLDADERLTPELSAEIAAAVRNPQIDGYYISLRMYFLGRALRHGDTSFYKLCLFRRGKARFECRFKEQDSSMCDMEVHEHVIVDGTTAKLKNPLLHHNVDSLARYIEKHNQYSNWEARLWTSRDTACELPPSLLGSQAQRRRWLRTKLFLWPGSSVLLFLYKYVLRLGFLDGVPGLIYCVFQAIQFFQVKAKIYELRIRGAC